MHPRHFAETAGSRTAFWMTGFGERVTYAQLEHRANQGAHLFRHLGLNTGDVIAILLDNSPRFLEIAWAAQRCGLYYACISAKLQAAEAAYIIRDSGARLLIASENVDASLSDLHQLIPHVRTLTCDSDCAPYERFETLRAGMPVLPIADEAEGADMLYSSGTTGRPKGIKSPLRGGPIDAPTPLGALIRDRFDLPAQPHYLSPAPLYHAAPLRWTMHIHRLGGTVAVMERFDAEAVLRTIEEAQIDCAQFVPTHFVRLLKLPPETRRRYDISSLRSVVHAAAPCPVDIKERMLSWFGPIIHEYYGSSEGIGMTAISPHEWLERKGSVGKSVVGDVRICDDRGEPLPPGQEGTIYFAGGPPLRYHNAGGLADEAKNPRGWTTVGDVGRIDDEGYLYLTDRKSFMIISGGVNIYPQEIEDLLIGHDKVADAAVIGAPDEEMGERVVAVVQPEAWRDAGEDLRGELLALCRSKLSHVKTPRQIEFVQALPRHPNGKLYKRLIRDSYGGGLPPTGGGGATP